MEKSCLIIAEFAQLVIGVVGASLFKSERDRADVAEVCLQAVCPTPSRYRLAGREPDGSSAAPTGSAAEEQKEAVAAAQAIGS